MSQKCGTIVGGPSGCVVVSKICCGRCGIEISSKAVGSSLELSSSCLRSSGVIGGICSLDRKSQREFCVLLRV